MNRDALTRLSKDDLIALVLAQAEQLEALTKRLAALEARIGKPPKTPDNSSVPPSQGHKLNRAERRAAKRKGRPGVARALSDNPDRMVDAVAVACPHCDQAAVGGGPARVSCLRPYRSCRRSSRWSRAFTPSRRLSVLPQGLQRAGSGRHGAGLAVRPRHPGFVLHLHVTQAISFERLVRLMDEVFGVTISEGAIANILARAEAPMIVAAEKIAQTVRASPVICSDETSARVDGKNWWQWVLLSSTAVYHLITDSRAAVVVTGFLQGATPEIWVADRYGGQNGHGAQRQVCLAHLLRDARTPSMRVMPDSPQPSSFCCCALFPSDGGAISSRTARSPSIAPTSTAASPGCWPRMGMPRSAKSSHAPSANAETTSLSSSPGATSPTPTMAASAPSDHP